MDQYQTRVLDNDLQVITVPLPALRSITALLVVNTGSRYEQPDFYGAAHLLEHVVFKGTEHYPSSLELSIALDSLGAVSNAFTGKESTGYYVTAASRHIQTSLRILKELMFYPLLQPADIEQEKKVVVEEIKMHRDSPGDFIADEFEQMVFKGTGLEHPISGYLSNVRQLNQAKLKSFLDNWYGLDNMVLVLAGDADCLTAKSFMTEVQNIFQDQPEGRADGHAKQRSRFLTDNPISSRKKLVKHRDTQQTHLVLGWPALNRNDPQRYVLKVLATVLGGNRSSRLFDVVREQAGLAYYIYSDVDQYHDGGILGARAGINIRRTEEGIETIIQEFVDLAKGGKPVTPEELERAQQSIVGKILLSLEHSRLVAQQYGLSQILRSQIETPQEIMQGIEQVTLNQVQALAQQLIKPKEVRVALVKADED